ncbi:MAG TPA: hypothetical protein VHV51_05090 [Polyangiaceae bacterium]|jgi:hypothetical protein|nr:hypothetical protein [Polyangiaceae bacterium]
MVTWIVGGAAVLMCVGLIAGAIRSHLRSAALAEAANDPTATALTPNAPAPSAPPTTQAADVAASPTAPVAPANTTDSARATTSVPVKKIAHASKPKHAVKSLARH